MNPKNLSLPAEARDAAAQLTRDRMGQLQPVDLVQLAEQEPHRVTLAAREKLSAITNWARNDHDPDGDGDQYPIKVVPGQPSEAAMQEWANAPELNILTSRLSSESDKLRLVTPFILSCVYGDVEAVRRTLEAASIEMKVKLVSARFLALRMSALM
jgi:hypothetical protein